MPKFRAFFLLFVLSWASGGAAASSYTNIFQESGLISLSINGAGSTAATLTFAINKPSTTATVRKAFLFQTRYSASSCASVTIVPTDLVGPTPTPLSVTTWALFTPGSITTSYLYACGQEITATVAEWLNSEPSGDKTFQINEGALTSTTDGEVLAVVWNRPDLPAPQSVALLFGGNDPAGDSFSLTLNPPVDANVAGSFLRMGLGIGFGFFNCPGNGISQYSIVNVNGALLTNTAGGFDRGSNSNGALITIGSAQNGANFSGGTFNPDVTQSQVSQMCQDHEYYNILQHQQQQGNNLISVVNVAVQNPSFNDIIFVAYFESSGAITSSTNGLVTDTKSVSLCLAGPASVNAALYGSNGNPSAGVPLTLTITAGPNAGFSQTQTTNAQGIASFSVPKPAAAGVDVFSVTGPGGNPSSAGSITWTVCDDACPVTQTVSPAQLALSGGSAQVTSDGTCACLSFPV